MLNDRVFTLLIITVIASILAILIMIMYIGFKIEVSRAVQCIEVYDGDELLYKGNEYFSVTQSRGTSTMWYVLEPKFLFPHKLDERISPNIRSNKCTDR